MCGSMSTKVSQMDIKTAITKATNCMGFPPLRDKQMETISSGSNTFVCLPTGYGKSIIYAILPKVFDFLLGMLLYRHIICNVSVFFRLFCLFHCDCMVNIWRYDGIIVIPSYVNSQVAFLLYNFIVINIIVI